MKVQVVLPLLAGSVTAAAVVTNSPSGGSHGSSGGVSSGSSIASPGGAHGSEEAAMSAAHSASAALTAALASRRPNAAVNNGIASTPDKQSGAHDADIEDSILGDLGGGTGAGLGGAVVHGSQTRRQEADSGEPEGLGDGSSIGSTKAEQAAQTAEHSAATAYQGATVATSAVDTGIASTPDGKSAATAAPPACYMECFENNVEHEYPLLGRKRRKKQRKFCKSLSRKENKYWKHYHDCLLEKCVKVDVNRNSQHCLQHPALEWYHKHCGKGKKMWGFEGQE